MRRLVPLLLATACAYDPLGPSEVNADERPDAGPSADAGAGDGGCAGEKASELCAAASATCGSLEARDRCGVVRTVSCGAACCVPETDAAFCTRSGKHCGPATGPDNCGDPRTTADCGNCTEDRTCSNGTCTCVPESDATFCGRNNISCGAFADWDNCGVQRSVANCGTCAGTCTAGACSVCQPETNAAFCARLQANCGALTASDNCHTPRSVADCGPCAAPSACSTLNRCECAPESNNDFCAGGTPNCGSVTRADRCGNQRMAACPACTVAKTLLQTGDFSLHGVTPDDFAIVRSLATGVISAVALAGGAVTPIYTPSAGEPTYTFVDGRVVFVWGAAPGKPGQLVLWSSATGVRAGPARSISARAAASPDGTRVAYTQEVAATASSSPPRTLNVAAGAWSSTLPPVLLRGITSWFCNPDFSYRGSTLILVYFGADCASDARHLDVVAPTGTVTSLGGQTVVAADDPGAHVFTTENLVAIGGSTTPVSGSVYDARFTADGSAVLFATKAGSNALRRMSTSATSSTSLFTGSIESVLGVETSGPTDAWTGSGSVLFASTSNADGSGRMNVKLASAVSASTPRTLLSSATGGVFGDAFTRDNAWALFYSGNDATNTEGTLNAAPVAGGAVVTLATHSYIVRSVAADRIVFNDAYQVVANEALADLKYGNATGAPAATLIAAAARAEFSLTPDRTRVVYLVPGATPGLYVATLP